MFRSLFINLSIWVFLLFSTFLSISFIGPYIETKFFPVIKQQEVISTIKRNNETIQWTMEIYKERNCRLIDVDWYLINHSKIGEQKFPIIVKNLLTGQTTNTVTYSIGKFIIGPFVTIIPKLIDINNLQIEGFLYYDCHLPWYTFDKLGPINIQD